MPAINEEAIVLRTAEFSETSLVVTFYTREHGKIACLAKGVRRLKNPFDTALDYMNQCRILYYEKSGDVLSLVTEAKLDVRFNVRSLVGAYAGFHVISLLDRLTENGESQPEIFDLTNNALAAIVSLEPECRQTTLAAPPESLSRCLLHFELELLREVGLAPSLDECVICDRGIDEEKLPRVAVGMLDGGVLCSHCRPGRRKVVSLSRAALQALRQLARPGQVWRRLRLNPRVLGEIRGVWNEYLANQLERPAPLLKWLKR